MLIVRNHQPSWLLCPFSDMLQTTSILSCGEVASQLLIWSVVPLAMFVEVRPRSMSGFIAVSRKGRVQLQIRMIFLEKCQRRRGVIFNPKNCIAGFGNCKQSFLIMKLIQNSDVILNNCNVLQLYYTYNWKSYACISYYPATISPPIYATISVIKNCNIIV